MRHPLALLACAVGAVVAAGVVPGAVAGAETRALRQDVAAAAPVPVSLSAAFDNDGIAGAAAPTDGDLASGYTYPAEELPAPGAVTLGGLPYTFPSGAAGARNNVVAGGQTIALPRGRYLEASFLAASTWGDFTGDVIVHYADGGTSTARLAVPDWAKDGGVITTRTRYSPTGAREQFPVNIFARAAVLDLRREAVSITLPPAPAGKTRLHVFGLTLQPPGQGAVPKIRAVRSTTKMTGTGAQRSQIVEVTVQNAGDAWVDPARPLTVAVNGTGFTTAVPAVLNALAPGEEARVRVGVKPQPGVRPGTPATGTATVRQGADQAAEQQFPMTIGVPDYGPGSLGGHEAPEWFEDAKFGIFIVWGPYSVPAWEPVGSYAEWYWNRMQDPSRPTYAYHRDTYGVNKNYDDFVRDLGAKFDPKVWLDLVRQAGGKYYVFTSKFHDGWAMYDSAATGRDTVDQGPKRDFVGELVEENRRDYPDLRSGLYYSLLEWFHPGYSGDPNLPKNPYTGAKIPYTGSPAVSSYVDDHMLPQMTEIVDRYQPDLVWCDGGWGYTPQWWHTSGWMAGWFNRAKTRGQDVAVDNRCVTHGDFTTPEYSKYPDIVEQKWEASRGMAYSYGYNRNERPEDYQTSDQLVDDLVDVVSKNGNLLLDIGPDGDGAVPQLMRDRLRDIGAWLKVNGESIYGSTYWKRGGAEAGDLRFTVKQGDAFYIHALSEPGDQLTVDAPVPVKDGMKITMLGYDQALTWRVEGGKLIVDVPAEARAAGKYVWTFKIDW